MKILLVTGASRGVGFEICKQAAAIGHKVLAVSRNIKPLEGIENIYPFAIDLSIAVSYTHLRAHETPEHLVCRLML